MMRDFTCNIVQSGCCFVMSVCPSVVRMEQFGFYETDFHEILYMRTVPQPAEKIQVLLKLWRE